MLRLADVGLAVYGRDSSSKRTHERHSNAFHMHNSEALNKVNNRFHLGSIFGDHFLAEPDAGESLVCLNVWDVASQISNSHIIEMVPTQ
jgi:hypothetical protein